MAEAYLLLVEDNEDDIELTLRAFRKSNLRNEIVVARDGAEAIALLHERPRPTPPLVVLLDLQLPKIDGHEVLRRIRQSPHTARLPVVVLTSSDEERDIAESYDLGANSFVQKPVELNEFMEAVQRLGVYWALVNEPAPVKP
jgi:two-component system response regulator